ncbi:pyocin knob domain-containing protein [Lactobacillus crispatus]|uniref:pyocin knob domain-containing protein n=2 Tax=Lactobacillus crispatus TaxID=47770 RepID=UPI001F098B7A|nr:pyocin knob domain-containing protein [Lactobacillus crispatus]MCT7852870.1 pyocin knob domain-containing protein [Lactobacillus crispatus]
MSTIRDPAYITDAGRTMMTAGGDVTYTKAVLYGQDISHLTSDQVKALTTIGSPLREVKVGISDKQNTDRGTTVILEATFQNDNLANDLPYTAVGFFAQKGNDEKLIAVAVANTGAYLTATSPDGIATDALDLKLAIAIGDATNVTATVDPAGSVTPATLNGAINKATHDLTSRIDTKADKMTVESELAIKANSTDIDKKLATKANSSDVYTKKQVDDAFSSRDATIATKADKATVDAEISKIDFTPYAKTADVSEQIKAVSDEVATKVGADYSYSKAQLDEKLLALSTDTNGKVNATQAADMITGKADKADVDKSFKAVNDSLATKADQATTYSKTDVDKLLSAKDDTTDVDAKIKTVTDLANTKASQDSLNKLSQTVDTKADKATVDAEIGKIDFTPYAKTVDVDSKVKTVTDLANTKDSTADVDAKIKDVTDKVNTKADQSNVNNQVQDAKNAATSRADNLQSQVNNLKGARTANSPDFDSLTDSGPYYVTNPEKGKNSPYGGIWGTLIISNGADHRIVQTYYPDNDDSPFYRMKVDNNWQPWRQMAKMIDISNLQNQINTKHNIATPLFREIQNSNSWQDIFGVGNPNNVLTSLRIDAGGSGPLLNDFAAGVGFGGADTKGVLSVGYHNNQARITGGNGNGPVWSEDIAWKSDINSLLNTITTLQNQVNDLINQINYIKQNYLQGKRFPANQEAQAEQWENANPNGIAMIEK